MSRTLFYSVALLLVSSSASAQVGWGSGGNQAESHITVSAAGVVSATPDIFFLDVSVTMQDLDLEKIQADVSKRCGQVVKAAREFRLDPARTFTRDYAITPIRDNGQKLISYRVSQKFRFALSDLSQAEALTTAVLRAGVTSVDAIEFTVADADELWEQAREKAVENTVKRAGRMAKAAGAKLGPARSIVDQGNQVLNLGCVWSPSDRTPAGSDGAEHWRAVCVSFPVCESTEHRRGANRRMRYCLDTVHWNNHASPPASDRFASQAAPVLPGVAVRSVNQICHTQRSVLTCGQEDGWARK